MWLHGVIWHLETATKWTKSSRRLGCVRWEQSMMAHNEEMRNERVERHWKVSSASLPRKQNGCCPPLCSYLICSTPSFQKSGRAANNSPKSLQRNPDCPLGKVLWGQEEFSTERDCWGEHSTSIITALEHRAADFALETQHYFLPFTFWCSIRAIAFYFQQKCYTKAPMLVNCLAKNSLLKTITTCGVTVDSLAAFSFPLPTLMRGVNGSWCAFCFLQLPEMRLWRCGGQPLPR